SDVCSSDLRPGSLPRVRPGPQGDFRLCASTTRLVRQNQIACLRPKLSKNATRPQRRAARIRVRAPETSLKRLETRKIQGSSWFGTAQIGGSGRTRTSGLPLIRGAL